MRLSKLELQGFKSFAKKTELIISDGVTAVIGPNGSGKSNLSDAIRWALGEQSARALRGNKMEDVIFNGTAAKHPLSMCSVSLTFENRDRYLSCDADEVVIARRAFRSGDSEYSINGKDCRLRDILDLFRDTGIGKDGYSVISQGGVDNILSNRTQDRREAIEEAVGVTRYRARREESIRKLTQAGKNIERLRDIVNELNGRLVPLQKESAKAKEALALQNELKALELNHFIKETEKYKEKLAAAEELLSRYEAESADNKTEDMALLTRIEEQERELNELETELSENRENQLALLSSLEKTQGAISIESERIQSFENEKKKLEETLRDTLNRIEEYKKSADTFENNSESVLEELKSSLAEKETAYTLLCATVETAEEELERLKSSVMDSLNRLSQARTDKTRYETMRETLTERNKTIEAETEKLIRQEERLQAEINEAKDLFEKQKEGLEELTAKKNELEAERKKAEETRSGIALRLSQMERDLVSKQSNLQVLRELVRKREGFQNSVRLVMNAAERDRELAKSVTGVVAEMITVPKEMETAIGTALGGALQYIVAPTGEDAKYIIECARNKQLGRVTVLPLDILKISDRDTRLPIYLSRSGVIGLASELITANCTEADKAIEFLLGRTLVVKDMNCALRLRREDRCYLQMVTVEGDILQSGGILSGGSKAKRSFDIISREREVTELEQVVRELAIKKDKLIKESAAAEEKYKDSGAALYLNGTETEKIRLDLERSKDKTDIINRDILANLNRMAELEGEKENNCESLKQIAEKLSTISCEEHTISETDANAKSRIIETQKQVQALRAERDKRLREYTEAKISLTAAEKDALAQTREKQRIQGETESLLAKAETIKTQIENSEANISASAAERDNLQTQVKNQKNAADAVCNTVEVLQENAQQLKDEIGSCRHRRDELLKQSRQIFEMKSNAEMTVGKLKTQHEQLADAIWSNYELTYENALPYRFPEPVSGMTERITAIRRRLKAIGQVNPGSVEEYEEVSARHRELSGQMQDMLTASADLEKLIAGLTKNMEKTFREGFTKIQEQFTIVFAELFGGGKAELSLKEPADVLNTEIDIIAQPPGKKFQLLSLMSGGERALTAIALLFAMLRIKSPSFCVLDEIESSLDEENVDRFASFLKQYGKQTQFIVITHRKGSMQAADSIYGVSMQEKGISTIISAKWEEAV